MPRLSNKLLIHSLNPDPRQGAIGLAWARDYDHDHDHAHELTGSVEGTVKDNCNVIARWGAAAVLSLTEVGVDRISLPIDEFARGVRERRMAWYHLPIRDRHVPLPAFEEAWITTGAELRALIRKGGRVVVHGEGNVVRSAMIIARLLIELGHDYRLPFELFHEFRPGLFPGGACGRRIFGHLYEIEPITEKQPSRLPSAIRDRAIGALVGLAVGDAVGTTLEFKQRDTYEHITDMVGGGPFRLKPGEWTDDTAMALALAETLQDHQRFDDWPHRNRLIHEAQLAYASGKQNRIARERMRRRISEAQRGDYEGNKHLFERALVERFIAWMDKGEYSCNGRCFDIGMTVRAALGRFKQTGNPIAGSTDPHSAGNGSLMRLAPVAIRYWNDRTRLKDYAARQSRTTHGAGEAVDACVAYAELLADAIEGKPAREVLAPRQTSHAKAVAAILAGSWRDKPHTAIRASGYVVHSLEAALWSVGRCTSFEQAVLTAANLGEDADTTAAIAGQLAGALYGASGIPQAWRERLAWHDRIVAYAEALLPPEFRDDR